jgi:formaldehyde-activating enzyme involved in methanogenesis
MPSLIGAQIAGSSATLTENYLRVRQSPGAALAGLNAEGDAPLLTFSTPNLRMFKVVVENVDLATDSELANSNWSKAVRALQVTSELFAVFAPSVSEGDSTFCFMAPDFNTNTGAASVTGSAQTAVAENGGGFSVVEAAIEAAVGGTATVTRAALTGTSVA